MNPRILLVPDWLQWITGTIAKAIKLNNPQLDTDIVPMGVVQRAVQQGWRPEQEFDVAHLLTTQAAERAGPALLGKIPVATTMHHIHDEADLLHDLRGDAVMVSCSQWEKDLLVRGVPESKIVRVPYGVDCQEFAPPTPRERSGARRAWGLHEEEVGIGFVGKKGSDNFGRKGFDLFCEGIQALRQKGVSAVPLVLGSGWQDDLDKHLGKNSRSIHKAYIPQQKIFYHAMDFYWVASRIEGGPVPLLEAMACGIPCVARPVGMVEDVVEEGLSGWIARSGKPEEFAERTADWLRSPESRRDVSQRARDRIRSSYDWRVSARKAPQLYRRAWEKFPGTKHGGFAWDVDEGEKSRSQAPGPLQSVKAMQKIPKQIQRSCFFDEDLNMVQELFRVRNRGTGSVMALGLMRKYPEKSAELLGLLFNTWFGGVRMTLGRWKSQILGRNEKSE